MKRMRSSMSGGGGNGRLQQRNQSEGGIVYSKTDGKEQAVNTIPPTEATFMTEIGGIDGNLFDSSQALSASSAPTFQCNPTVQGCKRFVEDGFFDTNGLFTFTEENNFVQLILYEIYSDVPNIHAFYQPKTCFIDMGGAMKWAMSNTKNLPRQYQMERLQQELAFAIMASFGIAWPRFCWWNNNAVCSGGAGAIASQQSSQNPTYFPQLNPVDAGYGNYDSSMFQQLCPIPPMILVQIRGGGQLMISINPRFENYYYPYRQFYLQMMTPRLGGVLDQGTYPATPYLNAGLLNGTYGWYEKGPYVFGFGIRNQSTGEYHDLFWTPSNVPSDPTLQLIGSDFAAVPANGFNYSNQGEFNAAVASRKLQKVVIGNLPCLLANSRYYFIRSPELTRGQLMPFVSSQTACAPFDTVGVMWEDVLTGNKVRDVSGSEGLGNIFSSTTIHMNPWFSITNYSLFLETEFGEEIQSLNSSSIIQGQDVNATAIKDNTNFITFSFVYNEKLSDQNNNVLNSPAFIVPAMYNAYAPVWKKQVNNGGYNVHMDLWRLCQNRTLIKFNVTLSTPALPTSPINNNSLYSQIQQLWYSTALTLGYEKAAERSVHFIRAITN